MQNGRWIKWFSENPEFENHWSRGQGGSPWRTWFLIIWIQGVTLSQSLVCPAVNKDRSNDDEVRRWLGCQLQNTFQILISVYKYIDMIYVFQAIVGTTDFGGGVKACAEISSLRQIQHSRQNPKLTSSLRCPTVPQWHQLAPWTPPASGSPPACPSLITAWQAPFLNPLFIETVTEQGIGVFSQWA